MTEPKAKVIGHISPGPLKGTRLVVDDANGGLTISILGEPDPDPPPSTPKKP